MVIPQTDRTGQLSSHEDGSAGDPAAWRAVCAVMFAVAWGGNQFTPLLATYRAESGFSEVTVNLLLFAYVVGLVPALLAAPAVARRYGTRRPLLRAVLVSAAGSLLVACGSRVPAVMFAGRALTGLALGAGMVIGGLALKSLAAGQRHPVPRQDRAGAPDSLGVVAGTAARTAALSLTAGFGLGAGAAGAIAAWLPAPTLLPYLLQILLCAVAFPAVLRSRPWGEGPARGHGHRGTAQRSLHLPRTFYVRVLPASPLIFGALGIAYAVLPSVIAPELGGLASAFSALLCVLSLGLGFAVQRAVNALSPRRSVPARPLGIAVFLGGTLTAVLAVTDASLPMIIASAALLGIAYGLVLVGCLQECELTAPDGRLGTMTGWVYTLAYLGFGLPTLTAVLHEYLQYPYAAMLVWVAATALVLNAAGMVFGRPGERARTGRRSR